MGNKSLSSQGSEEEIIGTSCRLEESLKTGGLEEGLPQKWRLPFLSFFLTMMLFEDAGLMWGDELGDLPL